jgi:hypothetical protein
VHGIELVLAKPARVGHMGTTGVRSGRVRVLGKAGFGRVHHRTEGGVASIFLGSFVHGNFLP